jgi:hypothetical protein
MAQPRVSDDDINALRTGFRGDVLVPADEGYDEARSIWNAMIDGVLTFDIDEVVAVWHHTHSRADFGLED